MSLKNLKIDWPDRWREASRNGNEKQLILRVYHVNPLYGIDSKKFADQVVSSAPDSQTVKIGLLAPSGVGGSFDGFVKSMKAFIASGFAPAYMTNAYIDDLHKKMTTIPGAEIPDESDIALNATIISYGSEDEAKQALKNYGDLPSVGSITGKIPGTNMSFADLLENDTLKGVASKEQLAMMKKMSGLIKEKLPEIKENIKKTGFRYKEGKFFGEDAVFNEFPNPNPPPKKAVPAPKKAGEFRGGGSKGNIVAVDLPKFAEPYSKTITMCQAVRIGNFVVSGSLLNSSSFLPSAATPCRSLSQTIERSDKVAGVKSTYIIPAASTYGKEGYFNKESLEKAIKALFKALKRF